ncbi:MAG: enolase C-terminal domain-like protein [Nannocystaceae bacterium]
MGPVDRSRAPLRVVGVGVQAAPAGDGLLLRLIDDEGRSGWGEAAARAGFSGSCASLQRAAGDLAARLTGRALDGPRRRRRRRRRARRSGEPAPLRRRDRPPRPRGSAGRRVDRDPPRRLPRGPPGDPAGGGARPRCLPQGHVLWDRYKRPVISGPGRAAAPALAPRRRLGGLGHGPPARARAAHPRVPRARPAPRRRLRGGEDQGPGPWPSALPSLLAVAGAAARAGLVLRVDCNGTMPRRAAPELLGALAAAGIDYVEEPCAGLDPAGWSALAAVGPALAVDESAIESEAFAAHLEAGAAAVVILKPCFVGGLFAARDRALAARARGLRVVVTSALEGPIGAAAAAHLALAIGVEEPCGITLRAGATAPAWLDPARASLRPPDAAGLGVEGPA